jgi:nitrate reductase gamma subunit
VQSIIIFDAFMMPLVNFINPLRILKWKFLYKFKKTQRELDIFLSGENVSLCDRFANVAKIFFVSLFYLHVLPSSALLAALGFAAVFFTDKRGIMSHWRRQASSSPKNLLKMVSAHVGLAIMFHLLISMNYYAAWPFDSVCDPEGGPPLDFYHRAEYYNSTDISGVIFQECNKLQWTLVPSVAKHMPKEQADVVSLYSIIVYTGLAVGLCAGIVANKENAYELFFPPKARGGNISIEKFTAINSITLYVPEFRLPSFRFPLIACDVGSFDHRYINWSGDHKEACLFDDAVPVMKRHGVKPHEVSALYS